MKKMQGTRHFTGIALTSMLLAGGCASIPAPDGQIARTRSALSHAEETGARNHAPLEYREAGKKLEAAEAAMKAEDYVEARRLAEQAEADADFAQARSESARAMASVEQLEQSIETLRQEINRGER